MAALLSVIGCAKGGSSSSSPPLAAGVDLTGTYDGEQVLTSILGCAVAGIPPIGTPVPMTFVVEHDPDTGAVMLDPGTPFEVSGFLQGSSATLTSMSFDPGSAVMREALVEVTFTPDGGSFTASRVDTVEPDFCQQRMLQSGER